ncbi:MFS transporter [Propionibacterium australiense]|uniref:MFS transporter n=1 Tax=Propionibacterium australiense TaxID=119981 RepID=A0A383S4X1_9ACTN|nr:MFS transporter [Propionibacterium australiense]RLP06460.1 MFS transporter [Propionibacterium australiense]RLP11595.1 MFS transporter [Propionibacterium australiense]SYZ32316.1 Major Facilitator Superfamily [Propionibacterium australiense]VEH90454.1 sucrose/H+ symporter [Propionibacterium australiense]
MSQTTTATTVIRRKPMMSMKQILLMNLGFFGIQYSFGMQQTAINPIYNFLGASPEQLPLLNMAGPITGLFIQPIIGSLSDRTWSERWGRRKPFFLIGATGCAICLFCFPFVSAVWMAALLLWLLDASNNTAMEPYRAFIADKLPPSQTAKGFLAQSFFTGLGITLANISLFLFQHVLSGMTAAGLPYWVFGSFMLGSVCSIGTVLVSVLSTPEIPPSPEELARLRSKQNGNALKGIWTAIVEMPTQLRKLALVYLFQWYAMNVYWQYVSLSVAKSAFGTTDTHSEAYESAVTWTGLINGGYNVVTFCVAFLLVSFAKKHGAKYVHSACLLLAVVGLLFFPHIGNKFLLFLPIIGLGIAWASIMGVPYIMAVRMVPSSRFGVYMGIINMMIVIPQLLQTLTFGAVYKHLLGSNPTNAITFAAVLLGCAALSMLWIKEPPIVRDVDDVAAPAKVQMGED